MGDDEKDVILTYKPAPPRADRPAMSIKVRVPAKWPPYGAQLRIECVAREAAGRALQPREGEPRAALRFSLNGEVLTSALVDAGGEELVDLDAAIEALVREGEKVRAAR